MAWRRKLSPNADQIHRITWPQCVNTCLIYTPQWHMKYGKLKSQQEVSFSSDNGESYVRHMPLLR